MNPEVLRSLGAGPEASGELVALVAAEIRRLAPVQARERAGGSPDEHLGNLLARVLSDCALAPEDRPPFLATYAAAVRRVVCEDLPKHGIPDPGHGSATPEMVLAVDGLLRRLERVNASLARVVECLYFARLNEDETAAALRSNPDAVQLDWMRARAWILKELSAPQGAGHSTEVSVPNAVWADAVLRNALALEPEDRVSFLTQFSAAAPALKGDVEELLRLAEHGIPGVPLDPPSPALVWSVLSRSEAPIAEVPLTEFQPQAASEPAPQPVEQVTVEPHAEPAPAGLGERRFGEWRILGELPPRGTGRLFAVERVSDSARGIARVLPAASGADRATMFEHLTTRLKALRHPRIAALLDAGKAEDGSFFLVHAPANGRPISRYCARHRPGTDDRVRLLIQLCSAIQDAHRALVAHGALADSRILVDDQGELTILDCGVEPLAASLAGESAASIGASTDVQQVGELVRDLLVPRGTTPGALDADLAAIVHFATRKEGADRYRSMASLRSDLQRWLERRPLIARGSARSYRAERFIVRHRVPVLAGTALAVASAVIIPVALANRTDTAREAARADAVVRAVASVLDNRTPDAAGGPPQATTYVDRAAALVRTELGRQPVQQGGMLLAIGRAYSDLGAYQPSLEALEEALRLRKSTHGDDAGEVADVLEPLGQVKAALGRYDEAESTLRMARAIRVLRAGSGQPSAGSVSVELAGLLHRLGRIDEPGLLLRGQLAPARSGSSPATVVQDDVTIRARVTLAGVLRDRGKLGEAEELYRQVLSSLAPARTSAGPSEPQHLWKSAAVRDLERARAQVGLAGLLISRGETDEPTPLLIDALQMHKRLHGPDHPAQLEALRTQARLRLAQQRLPEARETLAEAQRIHQDSVGVFTLDVPATRVLQAELALQDRRFADAVAASRLVLDEFDRLELGDHPLTIDARIVLGEGLASLGRRDEAQQVLERASNTVAGWYLDGEHLRVRMNNAFAAAQASAVRRAR